MSTGIVKQFVDFTTTGDTNQNEPAAIEPIANGEFITANPGGVANRPAEHLRTRSETLRDVLSDLLYLADADRHLFLAGPGAVTWAGVAPGNTGIFSLSDSIYLIPALTPGYAQVAPVPPVASAYGTLTLKKADSGAGLTLTSKRRSHVGGDRINVTVAVGTPLAVTVAADGRTVSIVTPASATLAQVRDAINALTADTPATQLLTAVVVGGVPFEGELILSVQAKQFIQGNYDGEAHNISPAHLADFFAADAGANVLREGDSLCIQYAYLHDPNLPPTLGGRRESIPENTNTQVPAGAFFNSRVHPERLVNALPIAKVINGYLCFINGINAAPGASSLSLNPGVYNGGPNWYDATTNPATTVEGQLDKIVGDLIATAADHSGADRLGCAARNDWLGGTTKANPAESIHDAINKIIYDLGLSASAADDGTIRIGAAATTGIVAGSVRSQLDALAAAEFGERKLQFGVGMHTSADPGVLTLADGLYVFDIPLRVGERIKNIHMYAQNGSEPALKATATLYSVLMAGAPWITSLAHVDTSGSAPGDFVITRSVPDVATIDTRYFLTLQVVGAMSEAKVWGGYITIDGPLP